MMATPKCPNTVGESGGKVSCLTAYRKYGCRCDKCLRVRSEIRRERYESRKENNTCVGCCSAEADATETLCADCKKIRRDDYERRMTDGRCNLCGGEALDHRTMCEGCLRRKREKYHANRERNLARNRRWRYENPEKVQAKDQRQRARKREALPEHRREETRKHVKVLTEIQQEYAAAGVEVHIDHVIPLSRDGLHVPENLRLVPAKDNIRKKDRLDEELDQPVTVLYPALPVRRLEPVAGDG